MRPTFSIICFTVLSGVGYGAWFLSGIGLAMGSACAPPAAGASGLAPCSPPFWSTTGLLAAFLLVSAGLLCSVGHLGKPARAWRALSQWRSSWLSREGIVALLTFVPAVLLSIEALAGLWLHFAPATHAAAPGWAELRWPEPVRRTLGFLLACGSAATVFCTANIYASLRPIRAWCDRDVVPAYLLLGVLSGCWLLLAAAAADGSMGRRDRSILLAGTIVLATGGAWIKRRYWRSIDAQPAVTTGRATGLEALGEVRSLEQPHTEENYLTHEMGFVLARKHAAKLRRIALVAAFLVPALLAALGLASPAAEPFAAWLALACGLLGLFVERWLFFAQARHAVMAFYGR